MSINSIGKLIFISIILSISQMTNAQSFINIKCKLLNIEDSTIISGAHVIVEDTNFGTITNYDGAFTFKIDDKFSRRAIHISSIGYHSRSIAIEHFIDTNQFQIYLNPNVLILNEVIVFAPDFTKEIFRNAIKNNINHFTDSLLKMKTFYRELLKQDSSYVRLTDAHMEIFQDNFLGNNINERKVKLIESRISDDLTKGINFESPPSILINKLRPLTFPPNFLEDHYFQMSITNIDTFKVYAITTEPKKELKKLAFNGVFYIRKYDLAFIGYDVKVSKDHIKYYPEKSITIKYMDSKERVNVRRIDESGSTRYFTRNELWYVRNVSTNATYQVSSDDGNIDMLLNTDALLVVYNLQNNNTADPKKSETINYNKPLSPTMPYNYEFWNSSNVLDYTKIEQSVKKSLETNRNLNEQFADEN